MNKHNYKLGIKELIALFLLFALATCSFFVILFFSQLNIIVKQILLYFGFFSYVIIILIILFYYLSKVNNWLNKDKDRIIILMAIFLALIHALFTGIDEHSWVKFFSYLAGDGVIIVIGFLGYKIWKKRKK